MRFLMSVIDDGQAEEAGRVESATTSEAAAIDEFNERLERDGHRIFAAGVSAPADATVVDSRGVSPVVSHGSFAESSSYAAGFWVIEASDEAMALILAGEASKACNRRIELRALL